MSASRIIVGVDGSEHSGRAVDWCAKHAGALGAEVVAVHVLVMPVYFTPLALYPSAPLSEKDRDDLRDVVARDWCKALADAGVEHRVVLIDADSAALALMQTAQTEDAELIVTGRRGHGGFAELLLGSTTHQLTHHADRPLVIVP